jgi:iron complex outermembrane receptor protein
MVTSLTRAFLLTSCLVTPAFAVSSASAQEADIENRQDTVIVTALKQGISALETPATISAITDEELDNLNITSATDLGGIVPGYVTMQGVAGSSNTFRGLGSNAADPGIESAVATFVDGIYLGHSRDLVMPLYDIGRIEFIPGTQATLLGKNSSLGAVSITSRQPGEGVSYNASATYVSEIEGTKFEGGIDLPLGPGWSVRAAGLWNDESGYVTNRILDRSEPQLEENSARLTLKGDLSESGTLTLVYQRDKRDVNGHGLKVLTDPVNEISGLAGRVGQTGFVIGYNDVHQSGSEAYLPTDTAGPGQFDRQTGDRASVTASFDIGNGRSVTSHTGYVNWDSSRVTDLDFTRYRLLDLIDAEQNEAFSQEIRINSDNGPITYLAGVLYYNNDYFLGRDVLAQPASVVGFSGLLESSNAVETEAWSVFGSGRAELSDRWALTGGLRYTDEEKTVSYERTTTGTIGFVLGAPLPATTLPSQSSGQLDGDIGLQFRPDSNTMYYLTFARGSKSGGFQSNPNSFAVAAYDGEVAYTTEAGGKFRLGTSASATLAVFNTIVEDFQVGRLATVNQFPQTVIDNSQVRSRGVEGAFQWDPSSHLSLEGSFLYADAEFTEDFFSVTRTGGQVLEAFDGMRMPLAPEWSARLAADYERPLSDNLVLGVGASLRYTGDSYLQFKQSKPLAPTAEAHTLIDARISLGTAAGGWKLSLIGNNLADDRYAYFASNAPLARSGQAFFGRYSRPRTVALQLSISD